MCLIQTYDSPFDIILIPYKANIRNTQQYFPYIYIFCFDIFQSATSSWLYFFKSKSMPISFLLLFWVKLTNFPLEVILTNNKLTLVPQLVFLFHIWNFLFWIKIQNVIIEFSCDRYCDYAKSSNPNVGWLFVTAT